MIVTREILRLAGFVASKKERGLRDSMKHIATDKDRAMATDGHVLGILNNVLSYDEGEEPVRTLLDPDALKLAFKDRKVSSVEVNINDDKTVTLHSTVGYFPAGYAEGHALYNYPDVERVFPDPAGACVNMALSPKYTQIIAKASGKYLQFGPSLSKYGSEYTDQAIRFRDSDGDFYGLIMPIRIDGRFFDYHGMEHDGEHIKWCEPIAMRLMDVQDEDYEVKQRLIPILAKALRSLGNEVMEFVGTGIIEEDYFDPADGDNGDSPQEYSPLVNSAYNESVINRKETEHVETAPRADHGHKERR